MFIDTVVQCTFKWLYQYNFSFVLTLYLCLYFCVYSCYSVLVLVSLSLWLYASLYFSITYYCCLSVCICLSNPWHHCLFLLMIWNGFSLWIFMHYHLNYDPPRWFMFLLLPPPFLGLFYVGLLIRTSDLVFPNI